jgi:phage shock protein PspC (stress-responsive transcriptional regulator)
MEKKLLRNDYDKVIAGVSSGLADYMQVDVTIIRLLFVLSTIFLFGTGILVYIVMWIVVPVNNDPTMRFSKFNDYFKGQGNAGAFSDSSFNTGSAWTQPHQTAEPKKEEYVPFDDLNQPKTKEYETYPKSDNSTGRTVGGLFLLVIGLYFLLNEFDIIPFWFSLHKLWPLVFVAIGLSFILKSKRKNDFEAWKRTQDPAAKKPEEQVSNTTDQPIN